MSAEFTYLAELVFVRNPDAASVDGDEMFVDEGRECAYCIRGGHVRQVGQVFAAHIYFKGHPILLISIVVAEHHQGLSQTSADVFLGKIDYASIGSAEIPR